jgi:hypothetical protein
LRVAVIAASPRIKTWYTPIGSRRLPEQKGKFVGDGVR